MNTKALTRLQETLKASQNIALEFCELLEKEKKHLTSLERDEISSLLQQKELLIKQLSGYQSIILSFCSKSGIEPSYGALRALLYRHGTENAEIILADWTALKNTLIKNQALNKTNEAILNELIRRNQIKQSILHSVSRQTDTYSAAGQKNSKTNHGWVEQV